MIDLRYYFWGHVGGCAAEGVDGCILSAAQTEAEVYEFDLPVSVDQYVFSLDVAMHDISFMQVLQSLSHDKNQLLGLRFS